MLNGSTPLPNGQLYFGCQIQGELPEWLFRRSNNVCLRITVGSMNQWFARCANESKPADDCVSAQAAAALFLCPWIVVCVARRTFTPDPAQLFLISDFAASVRECLTLQSQTTAVIAVCSGLVLTAPPTRMISQVNPASKGNLPSSRLLESLLIILYCAAVARKRTGEWECVCTKKTLLYGKVVLWTHTQISKTASFSDVNCTGVTKSQLLPSYQI